MAGNLKAVRGMNDLQPADSGRWQWLEDTVRRVIQSYGYREIRTPVVESTDVFRRSIGDLTDIVQKEMYSFEDRNGDSITLRPEGTAGCVRAVLQHGLAQQQSARLWYQGPMFRHERPQKGRYRQFHQFGVEAYGLAGPDIDIEVILLAARVITELGITDVELEINSLGDNASRAAYRAQHQDYLRQHLDQLDEDSRGRLEHNPLRILDSKNPAMADLIAGAPVLLDHLDDASAAHFDGLRAGLEDAGVAYRVNPRLVRGLDYYSRTVFEWITDRLGAQGTVCAGGRYDGLVEQFGGPPTPAVGFAAGIERLVDLLPEQPERWDQAVDCYVIPFLRDADAAAMRMAEALRGHGVATVLHCGGGSPKSALRKADRSGARVALLLGEDELASGNISIKYLREDRPQQTVAQDTLLA
ncbi:MAG: histidine--tRNA ligase, partial [Gammaproteobacteria bacterium]|nr:histidine--tRNA ligase [Gammaproteobacteria bacterium]